MNKFLALMILSLSCTATAIAENLPNIDPHFAAAIKSGDTEKVGTMLQQGFTADTKVTDTLSALCFVSMHNHIEIADLLISKTSVPNDGCFALAVANNNLDIVQAYLDAGQPVDTLLDQSKNTALHVAVRMNYPDMVEVLLDKGADKTLKNHDALTVEDIIAAKKKTIMQLEQILQAQ